MRLEGKVAVVTGSSRSIGAAVAKRYAREGAKVVINYRSHPELADQVVADIKAQGGEAFAYCADVSKEAEVIRMVDETVRQYGGIHILVNNAAMDPRRTWNEITVEEWDHVMGVNVRSQFLCAKAVFPYMQEQGYGKIINVSSVTFFTGQKQFLHYVTSKGAIIGFTRALAREVGEHGITVNCITPGAVLTETEYEKVSAETIEESARFLAKAQCFSRREIAADVEGAFVFLASPDSDFISGQTLNVDGGWMMH
ncbi:SDR family NAD(P)-dependent oxidoreductase [Paenibacillus allorhizosphaerae]|uniref:(S)-1-Phenylethanol dehydrogenase n=1 Tax=Paenibacillus allorhizosphaerae TaxID=2849866 RepID=A0ABN7TGK3_9BACL|nr:3-oxoacyl-ACP reductase family protein [Paenibacillus allorhizosphaerae]CAG7618366.1 (S)-1-Phenylethanol dehydrogenase [Paenibacillus allorhizosphaerae]